MKFNTKILVYLSLLFLNIAYIINAHSSLCSGDCDEECTLDSSNKANMINVGDGAYACTNQDSSFTIGWSDTCMTPPGGSNPSYMTCLTTNNLIQSVMDTITTLGIAVDMRQNFCSFSAGNTSVEGGIVDKRFLELNECNNQIKSIADSIKSPCYKNLFRGQDSKGKKLSESTLDRYMTNRVCDGLPNFSRPIVDNSGKFVFSNGGKTQAYCPIMRCNIPTDYMKVKYYDRIGPRTAIMSILGGPVGGIISLIAGSCCDIKSLSESEDTVGVALFDIVRLRAVTDADKICTKMKFSTGWSTVACKVKTPPQIEMPPTQNCHIKSSSCSNPNQIKSKTFFPFTSRMMQCVNELVYNVFRSNDCEGSLNPITNFQVNMRNVVKAMMILYIIIFGIKIALGGKLPDKKELFMFIIKFALVTYFAIGTFGLENQTDSASVEKNGLEFLFQGAIAAMSSFANMVIGNDVSDNVLGLCNYNSSGYGYSNNLDYSFLSLWDALDCRVAFYLGLVSPTSAGKVLAELPLGSILGGIFNFIWGSLFSFNFVFLIFSIAFGIFLLSILIYFAHLYIIALIAITIMIFMGPIFIPMALFDQTKHYFDGWVKLLLGFTLQPAIIVAFMALMMAVFDGVVYNSCEFDRTTLSDGRPFWVLKSENSQACKKSFGYLLANLASGKFMEEVGFGVSNSSDEKGMFKDLQSDNNISDFTSAISSQGKGSKPHKGLFFFNRLKEGVEDFGEMLKSLMLCTFFAFLFYYFAKTLSGFAADVSQSANIGAQAISPTAVVDAVKTLAEKALDAKTGGQYSKAKEAAEAAKSSGSGGVSVAGASGAGASKGVLVTGRKGVIGKGL